MKRVLFEIGPITIYSYGVMMAIGVLAALFSAEYRAKKYKLDKEKIFDLFLVCVISGIFGAKLFYWIVNIKEYINNPKLFLRFSYGLVVYGGIIVGTLGGYLYCRKQKLQFSKYADIALPSVALAQGFGRIGCFLAGCCYGRETTSKIGVCFHDSSMCPNGTKLIPTQLIMSGLDFIHFFVLILIARWLYKKKVNGAIAGFYLIFYSVGRFVMEFFRGDVERGKVGALSTSQFISIFIFIFGIAFSYAMVYRQCHINEYNEKKQSKETKSQESKDIKETESEKQDEKETKETESEKQDEKETKEVESE